MDEISPSSPHASGYSLSEESHVKLQEIRDQLFLLASMTVAATLQEEHTPLEVRRSMLAQCFENFGLQIDAVLDALHTARSRGRFPRKH